MQFQVMDDGLKAVASLGGSLTELTLKGCERITDDGVSSLSSLSQLTRLDIRCDRLL